MHIHSVQLGIITAFVRSGTLVGMTRLRFLFAPKVFSQGSRVFPLQVFTELAFCLLVPLKGNRTLQLYNFMLRDWARQSGVHILLAIACILLDCDHAHYERLILLSVGVKER